MLFCFRNVCTELYKTFIRKKPIINTSESKLARVLTALDLSALGVGSTLGVGVYVLAGEVSKTYAGPAVILSFLIAAVASVFAGLCYAEFGARVPKAGSAYIYSYVTIGEFVAFIIGWNLILEYTIGSASVVKGLSTYLDSLCGYAMRDFLRERFPLNAHGLSDYPDFFAFGVTVIFAIAIAFGVKESTILNNIFTALNLGVVLFVIIAGFFKVDSANWNIPTNSTPPGFGQGGFLPYGFSGVIRGAAICFYGFIGFDCIATAGEEVKNPRKSIPFAICLSLAIIFLAYFGVSSVLTMMHPYYEQDENAPLPNVFRLFGWKFAEYVVSIGAMFGLCASLMGAMFPLPRIVYAMASDGLLFKFMGSINSKFKTPINGTLFTGFLAGTLAAIFDLNQLVSMMSIGTLLAYSIVASCVLILRYESDDKSKIDSTRNFSTEQPSILIQVWRQIFNSNYLKTSNKLSSSISAWGVMMYYIWCFLLASILSKFENYVNLTVIDTAVLIIAIIPWFLTLLVISKQPVSTTPLFFQVPLVPWLPGFSILIDIYLMLKLDSMTWIRLGTWISIGLVIYVCYGARHSKEGLRRQAGITTHNSSIISNGTFSYSCEQ